MGEGEEDERRRGERIPINEEFATIGGETEMWVSNLSQAGAFVRTAKLLPLGETIELRFTVLIDDPVVIEVLGRVVRHSTSPSGMGVEFVRLRPEMVLRIQDALSRQRMPGAWPPIELTDPIEPEA